MFSGLLYGMPVMLGYSLVTTSVLLQLAYLSVESNNLTGSLPMSWSSMGSLQYISVAANAFSGDIPGSWSNLSQVSQAAFGCESLQDGKRAVKCSTCSKKGC